MIKDKLNIAPEHREVLKKIQESIPPEWTARVTKRELIAPATKEILTRALDDSEVSEDFKSEARLILDSGMLDKEVDIEQHEISDLIDAYTEKEILKAVALGKLPKLKKRRSLEVAIKRFNKLKENYDRFTNNNN